MGTIRKPAMEPVFNYLSANANRPITYSEIVDVTGVNRTSISGVINTLLTTSPGNMQRLAKGLVRWNGTAIKPPVTEILLRVTGRKEDGRMLAIDEESGTTYVVKEVEW